MANSNRIKSLPSIVEYPWRRRKDYLLLVAAVAAIDNDLHPDELDLLNRWLKEFKMSPKCREAVLKVANYGPVNLKPIQKRLSQTDLVYSLMLDLMGMAMADGVLMDKEISLLRGISDSLKVNPIHFNIMIEFIHSVHQASQLSNPEPLYQHNIYSAFELMRDKKVRLFGHTLLCVSKPKYDEELKNWWFKYISA